MRPEYSRLELPQKQVRSAPWDHPRRDKACCLKGAHGYSTQPIREKAAQFRKCLHLRNNSQCMARIALLSPEIPVEPRNQRALSVCSILIALSFFGFSWSDF